MPVPAASPARPAHRPAPRASSGAPGPVVLAVGNRDLGRLAMHFAASRPGARAHHCAHADVLAVVRAMAIDLVLLDVDALLMTGFVLAAQIRAADRGRHDGKSAVIVATTSSQCKFLDCHVGGSAIEGVLKMPCNLALFETFVDRWCLAGNLEPWAV